jgi:hemerythrin
MKLMLNKDDPEVRLRRPASTWRQAILERVGHINTLKNRGCATDAMEAEHDAIELSLQHLIDAVLSGVCRAEVIEILNTSIDFCATHFADEEACMRNNGDVHVDAHGAAHKRLLAKFVAARRCASGDGLALAALDEVDLLYAFHEHVKLWDKSSATVVPKDSYRPPATVGA